LTLSPELNHLLLVFGKPLDCIFECSAWPPRSPKRIERILYGLWNFLATRTTGYEPDLSLKATLHCPLALLIERRIAERLALLDPKRAPDARLATAPTTGEAKQALKFGLRCIILEYPVIRAG
jgi:hypothetical protein